MTVKVAAFIRGDGRKVEEEEGEDDTTATLTKNHATNSLTVVTGWSQRVAEGTALVCHPEIHWE